MQRQAVIPLLAALLLLGCASDRPSAAVTNASATAEPSPVELKFLERQDGIYSDRNYFFHLKIVNPHDQPMWYVFPYAGNLPLRSDGMFHSRAGKRQPFGGWRYNPTPGGGHGTAIKIEHLGRDRFAAFRLPPKGKLEFAWYQVTSVRNFRTFDCWEATTIRLGTIELERWLPYRVTCDPDVLVTKNSTAPVNLDWDEKTMHSRTDYPPEEVAMVFVEAKRKWVLPVNY